MGWFDEQIKKRVKKDNELFSDAFIEMSSVIMGNKTLADSLDEQSKQAHDAINVILRYYHITPQEIPISITEVSDQLDFLLRPTGIMRRDVTLSGTWYKDGIGTCRRWWRGYGRGSACCHTGHESLFARAGSFRR